jgi:hypothetical protein
MKGNAASEAEPIEKSNRSRKSILRPPIYKHIVFMMQQMKNSARIRGNNNALRKRES